MELIKDLDEKLIAELIPEVGPRIIFLSYWKKNFSQTKETSSVTSLNAETNVDCINKYSIDIAVLFGFI